MFWNRFFIAFYSLLMLAFASCTDGNQYINALPEDAAAVVAVDLEQLASKSGIGESTTESVVGALKSEIKGGDVMIDRIVKDPSESGLELTDKVYLFVTSQCRTVGLLARVSSKNKVDRLVELLQQQHFCGAPVESDGCTWTTLGGMALAAYTNHAFLLLANTEGGEPSGLQHRSAMWLRQKDGEGFAALPDFEKLKESTKDLAGLVSLNLIPRQYLTPLTMGVSANLKLDDIKSFVTLNFEDGMIVMDAESLTTDTLANEFLKKQLEATGRVNGRYLDFLPVNTGLWMVGNVEGGKLYNLLCENPTIRQQFENSMMPIDLQLIFNSIKGDVVFAMPMAQRKESFIVYADVTNSEFLKTFEDLKPLLALTGGAVKLVNIGPEEYEFRVADASVMGLNAGKVSLWFGVKDRHFYLTNDQSLVNCRISGSTLSECEWSKRVKGKRYFMALNMNTMLQGKLLQSATPLPFIFSVLNLSDYVTVESADGKEMHIEWRLKKRTENALKQFVGDN